MNILITGARGFIGSYFTQKNSEKYNIKTFSFLNDSFDTLELKGVDSVIHLSALVHQMHGATKEEYEKINVEQTIKLAQKAKSEGVRHFIFMSTVKVYGEESENAYFENSTCNPCDEYGRSKLKAEKKLQELLSESFKISIIRTPVVYGNEVKANIKSLVSLVKKVPIIPLGGIKNKRSFVFIGNLVALIECILEKEQEGVFLACDDEVLSTSEFIGLIAKGLNKKIFLFKIPFFEIFIKLIKPTFHKKLFSSLHVNNTQTKQKLHFKNPYTLSDGIREMLS